MSLAGATIQAARNIAGAVLSAYVRFALATTRWQVEGEAHVAPFIQSRPVVAAFWHESLPLMPAFWLRVRAQNPARAGVVMISRHRDGQLVAGIMHRLGLATVHGSTARGKKDKGGTAALRAALDCLAQNNLVVLTPDGPVGPARQAAGGAAALCRLSAAPLLPMAAALKNRPRLNTWDRMWLPLPFSHGALVCLPPVHMPRNAPPPDIAALLTQAACRAEALCR